MNIELHLMTIMTDALKQHWPEYLMEGTCLGLFMISAFTFGTILEHPASPAHQAILNPHLRRLLMGLAMGLTAISIIYSPWGKQSGAHINPSTTLTFFRLGKVGKWDAIFYILSQFVGGVAGALLAAIALSRWVSHPSVNYVVTRPGMAGIVAAFCAEVVIAFILMSVILRVSNHARLHKLTGLCAGALVATYITFEAPISGMSMNPARSFASAVCAQHWTALWVYFTAPLIGMFFAAEVYVRSRGSGDIACAKLHHDNDKRCIFCGKPAGKVRSKVSSRFLAKSLEFLPTPNQTQLDAQNSPSHLSPPLSDASNVCFRTATPFYRTADTLPRYGRIFSRALRI